MLSNVRSVILYAGNAIFTNEKIRNYIAYVEIMDGEKDMKIITEVIDMQQDMG